MKRTIHTGYKSIRSALRAGSMDLIVSGIGATQMGDPVSRPIPGHGQTAICAAHPDICGTGFPVAFHGHRCGCDYLLFSSLPDVKAL